MSRVGEWKCQDGKIMAISAMEDSHLRNSLRYLYRRMSVISPDSSLLNYYQQKFVELAEEAQKRKFLEDNISFDAALAIVSQWPVAVNPLDRRPFIPQAPVAVPAAVTSANLDIRAEQPIKTLALFTDVAGEVEKTISLKLAKQPKAKKQERPERNITFEL